MGASASAVFTARAGRVCLLHWRRFWLFTALFGTLPSENISIFPLGVNKNWQGNVIVALFNCIVDLFNSASLL